MTLQCVMQDDIASLLNIRRLVGYSCPDLVDAHGVDRTLQQLGKVLDGLLEVGLVILEHARGVAFFQAGNRFSEIRDRFSDETSAGSLESHCIGPF